MAKKRKKGEGTLRQRKDGRWEGRVVIGYDDNGNPKTKNVLAKSKKECAEKLEQLKTAQGGSGPVKVGWLLFILFFYFSVVLVVIGEKSR